MSTENWVTINGVHVLIGANGKITKGPAKFIGSRVEDLPGSKATGKYASKSKTTSTKTATTQREYQKEIAPKYAVNKDKVRKSTAKNTEVAKKTETKKTATTKKEVAKKTSNSSTDTKETYSKDRFKSATKEAKAKMEADLANPVKKQQNIEQLARLYKSGFYDDAMLKSVAMDNYGMSSKDLQTIIKKAGGKNTKFDDGIKKANEVRANVKGTFSSGGERYSYSMDGSYMVVKNSKGKEVASERVSTNTLETTNHSKVANNILNLTKANNGFALDVVTKTTKKTTPTKKTKTKSLATIHSGGNIFDPSNRRPTR